MRTTLLAFGLALLSATTGCTHWQSIDRAALAAPESLAGHRVRIATSDGRVEVHDAAEVTASAGGDVVVRDAYGAHSYAAAQITRFEADARVPGIRYAGGTVLRGTHLVERPSQLNIGGITLFLFGWTGPAALGLPFFGGNPFAVIPIAGAFYVGQVLLAEASSGWGGGGLETMLGALLMVSGTLQIVGLALAIVGAAMPDRFMAPDAPEGPRASVTPWASSDGAGLALSVDGFSL